MSEWFKRTFGKRCQHKWKLVVNKELDSAYEQLAKQGETLVTLHANSLGVDVFRKTGIMIMVCECCGEVNKTIVDTIGRREI